MAFNFQDIMGGLGNMGQGLMGLFGGGNQGGHSNYGQNNVPQGFPANAASKGGGMMSMFGGGQGINPGMMGAGLGIMGLGQMMNKPVKMPDFNSNPAVQSLNNWQNQPNHPMDPNVSTAMQNTLNIQNEQQLRNLRDVYANLRPGTDYTTDSNYQRDLGNLNRSIASQNADAMAGQQFNSNQQQLGNLSNMANLQVGGQMGQAAMDAARRQQQNQMFGNVGSMFLQRGLGQPDFMSMFNRGMF